MGSPFASLTTSDPIPLPFDPPHTVTVRKLTGREIEAAQEGHRGEFVAGRANAWAVTFRRALTKGASDPDVLKAIADPLTGYDRFSVVRAGLVAWSYPQSVKPVKAKAATKTESAVEASDAIDDLDDEAIDFIAREVLRLTKPALFAPAEEVQKNASGSSIEA